MSAKQPAKSSGTGAVAATRLPASIATSMGGWAAAGLLTAAFAPELPVLAVGASIAGLIGGFLAATFDKSRNSKTQTAAQMFSIQIQLHRPSDRWPSDHEYGEPCDSAADRLVGGGEKWSPPRHVAPGNPLAVVPGTEISVTLHESGPLFDFVVQNVDQIPNYISAIAAVISAWIAARALRKQALQTHPDGEFFSKSGTIIRIGDLEINSERNLEPDEIQRLLSAIANTRVDREK